MKRSQSQLLELTRCGLWGTDPDIKLFSQGVDWALLLKLAKEQTLLGVVSTAIEKLPSELRPARVELLRVHQMVTLNRQYRAQQIAVLAELLALMKRLGVESPVLLKGLGVGLNYPDPTLRQCGDIDLYIGSKHYFRVWDHICEEFGIERESNHVGHHFDFEFMDTHIEIHRYPTNPTTIAYARNQFMEWCENQLEGDELRRVTIEGVDVNLPPYNFDFIFIFYHTWKHFLTGGVGLRQLCDWCCYASLLSENIDRIEVARLIDLFKLRTPMSLFATIAVKDLGVDPRHFEGILSTSQRGADRVLNKIWEGGNFGFYREGRTNSRTILERKLQSFRAQFHDMKFMFSIDWRYAIRFYTPFFTERVFTAIKHRKEMNNKL